MWSDANEWMLDITFGLNPMPCFVPYDAGEDAVVFGLSVLTNRCPGKLVGVCSQNGQQEVEKWCEENPDWREQYANGDSAQQ